MVIHHPVSALDAVKLRKELDENRLMDRSAIVAASAKMARIIYTLVVKDRTW